MPIPSWAVAAGILIVDDVAMHYQTLTNAVLQTGLSELGKKGPTPSQTLRVDIKLHHGDNFQGRGGRTGYYQIGNERLAFEQRQVRSAIGAILGQKLDAYHELLVRIVLGGANISKKPEKTSDEIAAYGKLFHRVARLHAGM